MSSKVKKIIFSFVIVLIMVVVAGIWIRKFEHAKPSITVSKQLPMVSTQSFSKRTIPLQVMVYGITVSPKSLTVNAKAGGVIDAIHFTPGQQISKGQLLFSLHLLDVNIPLDKLKARMKISKSHYDQLVRVNASVPGSISRYDIQKAQALYTENVSSYNTAKSETFIRAPIAGRASDTKYAVGSSVKEGDVLVTVIDPYSLQVKYALPSQYSHQVKLDQTVFFTPSPGKKSFQAKVVYISPLLNLKEDNITLRADLLKIDKLQVHVFGKVVQVLDPNHQVLAVPQNLVQTDEQGFYVYVVTSGKVAKQYIQTGNITKQGYIEVNSGMTTHTPIIVSDFSTLSPGQNVRVKVK